MLTSYGISLELLLMVDFVKNMSAYADQNHAPSLAAARLESGVFSTRVF